jgi:Ca2+-binding EF-hand superfamily protein
MFIRLLIFMAMGSSLALQACSTSTGVQARAPETPRYPDSMDLKSFDNNGDDTLVRGELEDGLKQKFGAFDANSNGTLEPSEVRSFNDSLRAKPDVSPVIDWNADGKIVLAEFASQWRTMFERADIDRNGAIDPEELAGKVRENKPRKLPPPTFGDYSGRRPGS